MSKVTTHLQLVIERLRNRRADPQDFELNIEEDVVFLLSLIDELAPNHRPEVAGLRRHPVGPGKFYRNADGDLCARLGMGGMLN